MKIVKPIKVGILHKNNTGWKVLRSFRNESVIYFFLHWKLPTTCYWRLSSVFYRCLNKSAIVFFLWTSVTTRRNYEPNFVTFTLHPRSTHRICMCQEWWPDMLCCPSVPKIRIKIPTYRFHDFIQYGRLVWLAGSHIPFIDLQELPQLFDVHILLLSPPLLILALVQLRLRLMEDIGNERIFVSNQNVLTQNTII